MTPRAHITTVGLGLGTLVTVIDDRLFGDFPFDLQYRPRGTAWPSPWRARFRPTKNELAAYRLVAYGETAEAAVDWLLAAKAAVERGRAIVVPTPVTGPQDLEVGDRVRVHRARDDGPFEGAVVAVRSTTCVVRADDGTEHRCRYEAADRGSTGDSQDKRLRLPVTRISR